MEHPVHSFINNTLAQTVTTVISLASKQMKSFVAIHKESKLSYNGKHSSK